MNLQNETAVQAAKIGAMWGAIGISSWNEAAGFMAFMVSLTVFLDWVWKKVRPMAVDRGWLTDKRGKGKRKLDSQDAA